MALTEQQIQNWARVLSETENDKCVKTVAGIRKVLVDHFGSKVKVFGFGILSSVILLLK